MNPDVEINEYLATVPAPIAASTGLAVSHVPSVVDVDDMDAVIFMNVQPISEALLAGQPVPDAHRVLATHLQVPQPEQVPGQTLELVRPMHPRNAEPDTLGIACITVPVAQVTAQTPLEISRALAESPLQPAADQSTLVGRTGGPVMVTLMPQEWKLHPGSLQKVIFSLKTSAGLTPPATPHEATMVMLRLVRSSMRHARLGVNNAEEIRHAAQSSYKFMRALELYCVTTVIHSDDKKGNYVALVYTPDDRFHDLMLANPVPLYHPGSSAEEEPVSLITVEPDFVHPAIGRGGMPSIYAQPENADALALIVIAAPAKDQQSHLPEYLPRQPELGLLQETIMRHFTAQAGVQITVVVPLQPLPRHVEGARAHQHLIVVKPAGNLAQLFPCPTASTRVTPLEGAVLGMHLSVYTVDAFGPDEDPRRDWHMSRPHGGLVRALAGAWLQNLSQLQAVRLGKQGRQPGHLQAGGEAPRVQAGGAVQPQLHVRAGSHIHKAYMQRGRGRGRRGGRGRGGHGPGGRGPADAEDGQGGPAGGAPDA